MEAVVVTHFMQDDMEESHHHLDWVFIKRPLASSTKCHLSVAVDPVLFEQPYQHLHLFTIHTH